jgi:hypothetical protein
MWHGLSMLVNLLTLVLVTGAMALAAHLPAPQEQGESSSRPERAAEPALGGAGS